MITNIIEPELIEQLRRHINRAHHIVITCHRGPDGDAIGSTLAWCRFLRKLGHEAYVVTPDVPPRSLRFLDEVRTMAPYTVQPDVVRRRVAEADLIFCLDFNALYRIDQLGDEVKQSRARRILIDHHEEPDDIFDLRLSFPDLSSTCELVFRVILQMGLVRMIDAQIAQDLYLGMMTDTGNFTHENSRSPELYEIVAILLRRRFDKSWIYKMAMNTHSEAYLRIQGYALAHKMQLFPERGAALITLSQEELQRYNYQRGDTEELVNRPLAIPGIRICMMMRQDEDHVKVSARSEGDIDVNTICRTHYAGGGHFNAAGGDVTTTLDEAVAVFMDKILPNLPLVTPTPESTNQQQ